MVSEAKSDHTIDFFMATALTHVARDILAIGASTISFDKIKMKKTHKYYTCVAALLPQVKTG